MIETIDAPTLGLPEFNGDLSTWQADVDFLREAFTQPDGYIFEAQLPQVVGRLTEQERANLLGLGGDDGRMSGREYGGDLAISKLRDLLPTSAQVILNDMSLVGGGSAKVGYLELENLIVGKDYPFKSSGLHTDGMLGNPDEARLPYYVIVGSSPTLFYKGKAVFQVKGNHLVVNEGNADWAVERNEAQLVPAKPYDIVRMSYATVHAAPKKAESGGNRPFLRVIPLPITTTSNSGNR